MNTCSFCNQGPHPVFASSKCSWHNGLEAWLGLSLQGDLPPGSWAAAEPLTPTNPDFAPQQIQTWQLLATTPELPLHCASSPGPWVTASTHHHHESHTSAVPCHLGPESQIQPAVTRCTLLLLCTLGPQLGFWPAVPGVQATATPCPS